MKRMKQKMMMACVTGGALLAQTGIKTHAALGDSLQNLTNTASNEILGAAEIAGLIVLLIAGIALMIGKKDYALKIFISGVIGYFIIKYAPTLWNMVTGGI